METTRELAKRLRETRLRCGLTQKDVAKRSGIGEKSISSFETGDRIGTMKLDQLRKLLAVYGTSEAEFYGNVVCVCEVENDATMQRLVEELDALPRPLRRQIVAKFQSMVHMVGRVDRSRPQYVAEQPDWHAMASRN